MQEKEALEIYNEVYDRAQALTSGALKYNMYASGVSSDEILREEACEILKSQKCSLNKTATLIDAKSLVAEPEWQIELNAVLVEYWQTGETPEHLDEEWFDEMIERVTAQWIEEQRLKFKKQEKFEQK